jgi:hypothetical protein
LKLSENEVAMKHTAAVALLMLGLSIPAFGQDQTSCKAYFQVVHADAGSPGLSVGMSSGDKSWWESEGKKKYPGLCLDGSVTSGDKPRYLLIWSKSKSIGQASVSSNEVFGQTTGALQATAPKEWIYQPRWNVTSIAIAYVLYDGSLDVPPVHFAAADHAGWLFPNKRNALQEAVRFLAQEPVFSPKVD